MIKNKNRFRILQILLVVMFAIPAVAQSDMKAKDVKKEKAMDAEDKDGKKAKDKKKSKKKKKGAKDVKAEVAKDQKAMESAMTLQERQEQIDLEAKKIEMSKIVLQKEKSMNMITDEQYEVKEKKIQESEKALIELKKGLEKAQKVKK